MMPLRGILRWCALVVLAGSFLSCQVPDRYLIYPKEIPVHVQSWTEDVDKGPLRLHLIWAKPAGAGPWPTVLVHPDGSATAAAMRGVLWDLASQGYRAVAADYRRLHDGTYQRTLFPWCEEAEVTTVLEFLRAQPWVDGQRLAARLAALGRDVKLVVIPGGRHVFNFKQSTQAQEAWQVTLQWLARHLAVGNTGRQSRASGVSQGRSPLRHSSRAF